MNKKAAVDIVYHESRYTTYRADIDPDHYEETMGEPLRGSHPCKIEMYIYKNDIYYRIVGEAPDELMPRWVDVDHIEEWRYD